MAFDLPKAIEMLSEAVKNGFRFAETAKNRQSETEIIKEKKKLKKATDIAEKIILLTYKYLDTFSENDQENFIDLINDFKKYN